MKATVDAPRLAKAAAWAAKTAPAKNTLPVLYGLLITAHDDGRITLSAWDYEVSGTAVVDAQVGEPGRVLVSARLFAELTGTVGDKAGDFQLDEQGGRLDITYGRSSWSIPLMDADDYPALPQPAEAAGTVDAAEFAAALARVVPAVAADDGVKALTGVHLEVADGVMTLAATDRFRLAAADIPFAGDAEFTALPPARALQTAAAVLKTTSGPVDVAVTNGALWLSTDRWSLSTALVADPFPNWRRLVPATESMDGPVITVAAAELKAAVARALVVADRDPLALRVTAGELELTVDTDKGRSVAACAVLDIEGGDVAVGVRPAFLAALADGVATPTVRLHTYANARRPMLAFPVDDNGDTAAGYLHLLMPFRLPEAASQATAA